MVLDVPEQEGYAGGNAEKEGVPEVAIDPEFDRIAVKLQGPSHLHQGSEDPQADEARKI